MSINIVRFEYQDQTQWGVIRDTRITPVPGTYATTGDFVRNLSLIHISEPTRPY